ncbi:MAG: HDOD domain-containing protein [Desulfarculaceae bacterium]|jgi:putative nucleotidyltransferase with HDIG domain
MDKKELRKKIYAKIDELPTLPVVVARLLALIEDEKSEVSALTEVISRDPALTSKVLKVANSAYYGFSQEISSLDRAVALLGLNMVKSLALSIGVVQNLPQPKDTPLLSRQGLWLHSLAVATAITELSRRFGAGKEDEYLFVVGLLHDVGKIVLLHFFAEPYKEALERVNTQDEASLYLAERQAMGFDHGEVGAMLLSRWKFPQEVIKPILVHHQQAVPSEVNPKDTAMLKVADALPQELDLGEEGNPQPPGVKEPDLQTLGMSPQDLAEIKEFLVAAKENILNFYSAMN